jgi:hypothetical protein
MATMKKSTSKNIATRATPGSGGAERRMDGGLGAKKVDVTWATEESGLLLALSVKTINFKDQKTSNYQKNLANRRNDMLLSRLRSTADSRMQCSVGFFSTRGKMTAPSASSHIPERTAG